MEQGEKEYDSTAAAAASALLWVKNDEDEQKMTLMLLWHTTRQHMPIEREWWKTGIILLLGSHTARDRDFQKWNATPEEFRFSVPRPSPLSAALKAVQWWAGRHTPSRDELGLKQTTTSRNYYCMLSDGRRIRVERQVLWRIIVCLKNPKAPASVCDRRGW